MYVYTINCTLVENKIFHLMNSDKDEQAYKHIKNSNNNKKQNKDEVLK